MKLPSLKSLTNSQLRMLILITILVNAVGLLFPVLASNDATFYAIIAKHIVISHDWINLTFAGTDWLDKPHFPFWLTAISYKCLGIHTFSYILPGFVFSLIGAYYTYRLASHLYRSKEIGLLSSLFYLSALHLMMSAIDVRAEAFLLGEIIPACYYWLLYDESNGIKIKNLLLGAIFTALAIMTKGVFTLITIFSGLFILWAVNKDLKKIISIKWGLALLLIFIFITPELLALYSQFDAHPEKVIFGKTHVSGIKWFFWDSQFGRFFETGPITIGNNKGFMHYFFFVHTFLWAFLPWTLIFGLALWSAIKSFKHNKEIPDNKKNKAITIYLLGSFFPTFILFSLTKFQLDHYTNILIPFAAIMCAGWIFNKATRFSNHPVFILQIGLAFLLTGMVLVISAIAFNGLLFMVMLVLCIIIFITFVLLNQNFALTKAIVFPIIAINLVFIFAILVNGRLYLRYDAGLQIARYINKQPPELIVDYKINLNSLEFHANRPYLRIDNLLQLEQLKSPYYLLINQDEFAKVKPQLGAYIVIATYQWLPQEKFIPTIFILKKRLAAIQNLILLKISG